MLEKYDTHIHYFFINILQTIMSSIKIMCRIKPNFKNNESCIYVKNNNIVVQKIQKKYSHDEKVEIQYEFQKIFDENTRNIEIYKQFGMHLVKDVMRDGKNVTFYVYGQTGSGKTHTLLGANKEHGFLSILLCDLLEIGEKTSLCVAEIYNNKCYDLFQKRKQVYLRSNANNEFQWSQLDKIQLIDEHSIRKMLDTITDCRRVGISSENDRSSRSHLIIQIQFRGKFIRILDLAGCEKAQRAICTTRKEYYENGEINQNLFALKECIRALLKKQEYIPYRRCELTKILKQSFEPSNKTYILATVSQDVMSCSTTIDVLNYIHSIKQIKSTHIAKQSHFQQFIGSPRFNNFMEKQKVFKQLSLQEKNLLESMIQEKSTRVHMESYAHILHEKRKLLKECIKNT